MPALPGDLITELLKNADGVALADTRNFWRNLNGDQFAGETHTLGFGRERGIFFRHFQPELEDFPNIGQRLSARRALALISRQGGTGNRKTFFGLNQDDLVLHVGFLKQPPEFRRGHSSVTGDASHGVRINRICPWNNQTNFTVGHHNVAALPDDAPAQFFKSPNGVLMANPW